MREIRYYNRALEQEKAITDFVTRQAEESGFKQEGLDQRVKSKDSYLRKMRLGYSPEGKAYSVQDILRYTYAAPAHELSCKIAACIASMASKGYNTIEIKNYWLDPMNPYKGVNTIVRTPSGQAFEIQYHTPESFAVKNGEMHRLYQEWRTLTSSDPKRKALKDKMQNLSTGLERPVGIEGVK